MEHNIAYTTDQIARYFSSNRITWDQFYESEKKIISQLNIDDKNTILDIGCGCGGLGLALKEKFGVSTYTGVEINEQAAAQAKVMNDKATFLCGDILDLSANELKDKYYDVVFSLSCVDWNVQFINSLTAAWKHVKPGGYLVATFRLTDKEGINDIERSYQYINFEGKLEGELASYVVLNIHEMLNQLSQLNPAAINAFGYWGAPSVTAVTPFEQICFAAFTIQKKEVENNNKAILNLDLPMAV